MEIGQTEIAITFKHVLRESELPDKDRREFAESINQVLEPIKDQVILYQGTVEVIESKIGNFCFKSECKNTAVQSKMNDLISRSMPKREKK